MSGSRNNQKKKTKSQRAEHIRQQETDAVRQEVILWVMLAVSIVLFVSNLGIGGTVGGLLSSFMFGCFGLLAYIFPILLFVGTVFVLSNRKNTIAAIKVAAAILFVCFLCLFLELVAGVTESYSPVTSYVSSMESHNGGGFFGGLFAWLLCPNFGRVSAYVIDFIVLIITMVIVTEHSAWKHVERGGRRVYESARESNERFHERQELRREERESKRMEHKVSGVSIDTKLTPDAATSGDAMREITVDSYQKGVQQREAAPERGNAAEPIEPLVSEQRQVNLQPSVPAEPEAGAEDEPIPVFSPELQRLFAEVGEEFTADEPEEEFPFSPEPVEAVTHTIQPQLVSPEPLSPEPLSPEPLSPEPVSQPASEPAKNPAPEPARQSAAESASRASVRNPKMKEQEAKDEAAAIAEEIEEQGQETRTYVFPPLELLQKGDKRHQGDSKQHLQQTALKLQQTLKNFGVNVTVSNVSCGPTVTRYEIQPEMGVKVSKIVNLTDDIKLNLAAADIRMEAPIPGKAAIGIEVPNKETTPVMFRDLVESSEFQKHPSSIAFAAGRDIGGQVIMADIAKMPHLLIAGATGSGKSVCINTIIMSILYRADPEDVKLILIDPKVVELSVYNGIPHLFIPVVTDPKKAAGALNWAVAEMTERYQKFAEYGVRDLKGYNAKVEGIADIDDPKKAKRLPQIVIIVDELADLMMVAPGDVEDAICRLAQLARACGIHLIIATQRPSVNVITGLIKANMPSRIAFSVTSGVDSRTILDMVGAEKLLGKGDCLYYPQGLNKPLRVQGAFVSDQEVAKVVDFIKESYGQASYDSSVEEKMSRISESTGASPGISEGPGGGRDDYFVDAAKLLMDKDKASIGMLQRYFKIGFNRAARIMDQLEEAGVVGPEEGTKPRQILMNPETFESLLEDGSF
jgi:S-DNA-T family DNA segregation ATPase FtsK/SpoIIIE